MSMMECRSFTSSRNSSRGVSSAGLVRKLAAGGIAASLALGVMILDPATGQLATAQARGSMPGSFADLAEKVSPAVVNISTTASIPSGQGQMLDAFPENSPFREFFERFMGPNGLPREGQTRQATSLGSGFVIDASGYIVTNNHVIKAAAENGGEVSAIFSDGRSYDATIVGRDPKTDLALLKIEADEKLPVVEWGKSSDARVGDWVIAVGNPFGLGGSVSAGIISALGRNIRSGPYDDFLQLDAAINRGNSGGPSFNMDGEVIGVNTAIFSPNGGNIGIGFAIPSDMAREVIDDLRKEGHVERAWLGVHIQQVTPEIADSLGLDKARGALVASVAENGPARDAGLKPGDVILEFNGEDVDEMRMLPRLVAWTKVGSRVPLVVWRDGEEETLRVTLARMEEDNVRTASTAPAAPAGPGEKVKAAGFSLSWSSDSLRRRYHLETSVDGAVIVGLETGSPAVRQGLREGDVIIGINQKPVGEVDDVVGEIERTVRSSRKSVLLHVHRQGAELFVPLRLAED